MALLRLLRLALHLLRGIATCALVFPFIGVQERQAHIRRWSQALLSICGVELRTLGPQLGEHTHALLVANHVSWLDIFVVNAVTPCRFVAKSEIRDWPLIGWLCEQVGTIFIARGKLRDVRRIYQGLVESLQAGERVAFFPEGTVSAQGTLRAFHANLFEAAIDAKVPVQPVALRYLDGGGNWHEAVRYVDPVTFVQSVWKIARSTPIVAELVVLPPVALAGSPHRRELADAARATIAPALGIDQIEPGSR